jgi:formylglycine-generating enzyme required for sulfatase activity
LSLLIASSASSVTMEWTPIRNPGNACDPQPFGFSGCYGSVGYAYNIGTYEVTNAQYAEFLNAKATSDPLGLYNTYMGSAINLGGITRTGSSGSYGYSAIAGRGDMPVNFVSFYDTVRFANWMNNGQGNGDTETGSYTLLGGTATPTNAMNLTRNAGAVIAVTSENEWYKAAYYDPTTMSYFDYPAGSDTRTTCAAPSATPNTANCGYAVNDLTSRGSYSGSASPYGTFDQGGNVWEWLDTRYASDEYGRRLRGGDFDGPGGGGVGINLDASSANGYYASAEFDAFGFRLAMVSEPSTGLLVTAGLVGLAVRGRACA